MSKAIANIIINFGVIILAEVAKAKRLIHCLTGEGTV